MDHNKFSSDNLLVSEFIDTPYGNVCKMMEVKCVRCHDVFTVKVPDSVLEKIDSEEQTGTALIEYVLETKGWAQKIVNRISGKMALYSICPECVEKDFESLNK